MDWRQKQTEHYLLFYHPDSVAEKSISEIALWQEKCYRSISKELGFDLKRPVRMYLCNSGDEISRITGCPPCNAMTFDYDLIYAVCNETVQCLGPHEDAHLFSYQIAIPDSVFLKEGFAMYFDGSYHGRENTEIARDWWKAGPNDAISVLLDNRKFQQLPEEIAYPLAGAFTAWFIRRYGMSAYLDFYRNSGSFQEQTLATMEALFAGDLTEGALQK